MYNVEIIRGQNLFPPAVDPLLGLQIAEEGDAGVVGDDGEGFPGQDVLVLLQTEYDCRQLSFVGRVVGGCGVVLRRAASQELVGATLRVLLQEDS